MRGVTNVNAARYAEMDALAEDANEDARSEPPDPEACRELWVAVLADAFWLVQGIGIAVGRGASGTARSDWGRKTSDDRRKAYWWLTSADEDVGSFRWVCWMLDLDPDVVVAKVLRRLAA